MLQFIAVIKIRGINPYVHVDAKLATRLKKNWRRPLPVLVRINRRPKKPWRINMMPAGEGNFFLYLHSAVRRASETAVGDRVIVQLSFDSAYRGGPAHPLPSWFSSALAANREAQKAWKELVPSRKKEILRYFAALKSADAKQRNLKRVTAALSGKKVRFMARSWKESK